MTDLKVTKKLLIISHDKIGSKMAGPGIRYHFMAEYLSSDFEVTIGFFTPEYLPDSNFEHSYKVRSIDAYSFEDDFEEFDFVIALWLSDSMMAYCNLKNKVVIFDIYAPVPVENLAVKLFSQHPVTKDVDFDYNASLVMYRKFLENGDLFLYSNERQRDFWVGFVFGALQVSPSTYEKRPMYEQFIKVPMGIDTKTPIEHKRNVLRNVVGNIKENDTILLWTGGIWDWFDAVTLIDAMSLVEQSGRNDIKLVFLGTKHPNDNTPDMSELSKSRQRAVEKNLLNDTVYFLDGWIDYNSRTNYLAEADIAIYSHKPSIETEFSHRTRVLDHIFAGIPTIGTRGDYLGDMIEREELGIMVDPLNSEALAKAIIDCSKPRNLIKYRKNIEKHRKEFSWESSIEPLRNYLLSNPKKLTRLPSTTNPLNKRYVAKIKKVIPKPVKIHLKRLIRLVSGVK